MSFLTDLQNNIALILALVGIVVGIVASFSFWSKEAKKNRKDQDDADTSVRDLLREEIEALNKKITRLTDMAEEQARQIETLKTSQIELEKQNNILTKIFQGRDEDAVSYRKSGREAMRQISELSPLITETNGNCKEVLKSIDKLYKAIEQHLKVIEGTTTVVQEKLTTTEHKTK